MSDRTPLVCVTHTSNLPGSINPIRRIADFVHARGARICVDGVAYAPRRAIDVDSTYSLSTRSMGRTMQSCMGATSCCSARTKRRLSSSLEIRAMNRARPRFDMGGSLAAFRQEYPPAG
jgi:cysteine sulfinate desulfinase/cysteine desulfurase-like protein